MRNGRFVRFAVVGGVGFCVDGGLLTLLIKSGLGILAARSVSFLSAVTCTWLLNRLWTFRVKNKPGARREYASYIVAQGLGALINLAVFFALIEIHPFLRGTPLIPLALGAAVALAFNFAVSRKYVFKG